MGPVGKLTGFLFRNKSVKSILTGMLELHAGQIDEKIIVTLTELSTLPAPHYLFVFTHILTKQVVSFVAGVDQSIYTGRFNEFLINTNTLFAGKPDGGWQYVAYEQISPTNTDPANATGIVEHGKMILYAASEFEYDMYNQPVTYKAYES